MADFVVLATADWDHRLWTNKQHTALSLQRAGHRVLYIESLGLRPPRADRQDSQRIVKRLRRMFRPPRQVEPGLWVWSPMVIPGGTRGVLLHINRVLFSSALGWILRGLRFRSPLLWTYNPLTGRYLNLKRRAGTSKPSMFSAAVYHCVDRIHAQPGMPATLIADSERQLCRTVNVVFTTSPDLQASLMRINACTYHYGNVADQAHFAAALDALPAPDGLAGIPKPRLMFVGAIDAYKLDLPMLTALARQRSDWSWVLLGPVGEADPDTSIAALQALPNVHVMGLQAYDDLPAWLAHADVALLPLQENTYTQHMFPMKFFEYLAAGRPVVATQIPALRPYASGALLCPPDPEAFEAAIATALSGDGPSLDQRLALAAEHTYESRTQKMLHDLQRDGLLDAASSGQSMLRLQGRTWPLQRVLMPALFRSVRLRNRCGRSEAGRQLLRWIDGHHPVEPQVLDAQIPRLIKRGLYSEALALMERSWLELGRTDHLHHLLFRRGARPKALQEQISLFETLGASSRLPLSYRAYCRVVCAYRSAELNDPQLMRASIAALDAVATGLEDDPNTRLCRQGNRFNRAKLLISCYATTLRLQLTLADRDGAASLGRRGLQFSESLDLTMIETETSFRLTRNLMRVLSINIVEAWASSDATLYWRARRALQAVHDHAHRPEHDEREVQEDHRAFAVQVMERVVLMDPALADADAMGRAVEDLMLLLFRAKIVSEAWRAERLPGVLPCFKRFLHPDQGNPGTS
ncbi:glycosyltransferase [Synechococcus sp. PROS-U-1]|uniref:glycosyltransferase n=1 Tax=Synechococcus sp. PROS-U-1 TaxID=1400866 RepID=UPI001648119B|nr:glycosyltransferase [Synechococcus sp. PROS-U-1]QNJ01881.1 UDP-glycosyltransferase/glycogen phosphorylase [Synechococcus sp. PROS-U-1]